MECFLMGTVNHIFRRPGSSTAPVLRRTKRLSNGSPGRLFGIDPELAERLGIMPIVIIASLFDTLTLGVMHVDESGPAADIDYTWSDDPGILALSASDPARAVMRMLDVLSASRTAA
jgi:hypothetical protein